MAIAKNSSVLWLQVWGLAAVQGAIALTWVFYNLYLPKLLGDFGFPVTLATGILLIENLLAAVMEPLMGNFSDRTQRWVGSRFPFIAVGIILASVLFLLIPTVAVFGGNWSGAIRWLLPIALVAWALAMTVFRSPALSLLGRYAFGSGLPQAASILTLVGATAGAIAPFANTWILGLGAMPTFFIGSIVLLGAAAALRSVHAPVSPAFRLEDADSQKLSIFALGFIFVCGVGVAIGFRMMMQTFPAILTAQVPTANPPLFLGLISVAIALTAIPSGTLAAKLGNTKAMLIGLITLAVSLFLTLLMQNVVIASLLAIALGAAFSLVSNGTIPFALSLVPPAKAGLGTGMFFSGGAIGLSLFFSAFNTLSPPIGVIIGAIAFLLSATAIFLSPKQG